VTNRLLTISLIGALSACLVLAYAVQQQRDGYKDTPILPNQKWHVHDSDRPYPPEIVPGATFADPPSDATILYNGGDLSQWIQTDDGTEKGTPHAPQWTLHNGYFEINHGTGYLYTKEKFGDCQLHVEWEEPEGITGFGQERGNSGVFLMSKYEIQVLDSYRAPTYADGQAGAIYGQWPPLVNPMRKPGEWQSYDVIFNAPKFEGDKLVEPAYMTVFFNGVLIHNHQKLNGPTQHRVILPYEPGPAEERLALQDHDSSRPVRYRNIWIRRLKGYDEP
jgi:hypothetical protein